MVPYSALQGLYIQALRDRLGLRLRLRLGFGLELNLCRIRLVNHVVVLSNIGKPIKYSISDEYCIENSPKSPSNGIST